MKGVELQQQKTSTRETGGKAVTTFLLLHGTGGNERGLIQLACELDQRVSNSKSQRKRIRQRRCIPILCETRRRGF
jgi:predicted esterase